MKTILEAIQKRTQRNGIAGGIGLAIDYVSSINSCLADGVCAAKFAGADSRDAWAGCIKEAESKLTWRDDGMLVKGESLVLSDGIGITPGACLDFECVITSSKKDRDGDVMEPTGAILDPRMPLLWQHLPLQPIGKMLKPLDRNAQRVRGKYSVIDSVFGRDVAQLISFGVLRISHGFRPIEYEPLKGRKEQDSPENGWHVKRYEIMEVSVVSCPSNTDAEIDAVLDAFGREKLHHQLIKGWAGRMYEKRPAMVTSGFKAEPASTPANVTIHIGDTKAACACKANKERHGLADPRRWNKSLGNIFDQAEPYDVEPSTVLYGWVSKYLDCEIKHIFPLHTGIPSARMGSFLTGLKRALAGQQLEDTRNFTHGGKEEPPVHEVIQLTSATRDDFLVEGMAFYKGSHGKFIVKYQPTFHGLELTVYSHEDVKDFTQDLVDNAWDWARANNFLKGEAFALSGEFLERTSETWGDVFLEEKNKQTLQRTIDLLNEKGKDFANRGVILTGPAGTGKTLSGRIIRNTANATFIWVSSRDFHYAGSFGGIAFGFELAKELAPAVLFIEDCDNWLYDTTIDLIKTEMDGISRSKGVLTILTTNYPENLPPALIDRPGRFHDVLKFDLPSAQARQEMLTKWLAGLPAGEIQNAVAQTSGYSGAHVYELAHFAKTLQDHDGLAPVAALQEALRKVEEQRELISDIQTQGSSYRPRRQFANERKDFSSQPWMTVKAKELASDLPHPCKEPGCKKPAVTGSDWCEEHDPLPKSGKSAVPFEETPKSDKDNWDADAAIGRLRAWSGVNDDEPTAAAWGKYRRGFAWYDDENLETFGAYKLPHHDVEDGKLVVVFRGVAAAMAALNGGRGGIDISEADKQKVYAHLKKHYKTFDQEPPELKDVLPLSADQLYVRYCQAVGLKGEGRDESGRFSAAGKIAHGTNVIVHNPDSPRNGHTGTVVGHTTDGKVRVEHQDGKVEEHAPEHVEEHTGDELAMFDSSVGSGDGSLSPTQIAERDRRGGKSVKCGCSQPYSMLDHMPRMPFMEGSYEDVIDDLEDSLVTYLEYQGVEEVNSGHPIVIATFPARAIIAIVPWSDPDELCYYRIAWSMQDDEAKWTGPAVELEVSITVQEQTRAAAAAWHKRIKAMAKEHLDRLNKAHDLVHKAAMHDSMPEAHKGKLSTAKAHIKAVYNTLISDKPNQAEEQGKPASTPEKGKTSKDSMTPLDRIKAAHGIVQEVEDADDTPDTAKAYLKDARGHLKSVQEVLLHNDGKGKETVPPVTKAGKILSTENQNLISQAHDLVHDVHENDKGLTLSGKTALHKAKGHLKSVLDKVQAAPNPETEGSNPGAGPEANPGVGKGASNGASMDDLACKLISGFLKGQAPSAGVLESLREAAAEASERMADEQLASIVG